MTQLTTFIAMLVAAIGGAAPSPDPGHAMDVAHSTMTVYVYKSGLFAFAADNHTISAPIASGSVDERAKTVDLTVNAGDLKVLDPGLSPDRRGQIQARMESPDVLDPARFPKIEFKSTSLEFDSKGAANVAGDLTLHGQTHKITVHVTRASSNHYNGKATILQTDFGITPIRIIGGTVKVKNNVDIAFDIATR
jgi:polyisoprenoid-binding protein YceI